MARSFTDARRWSEQGTKLFVDAVVGLTEERYDEPTLLPGWDRRQLVAHVAANADALSNLAHWASSGVETPMYASPEERAAGIARGASMTRSALTEWLVGSASALTTAMSMLTQPQWQAEVVTAQSRTVPATELPWMRSREVLVHAVDLDLGITFADLPDDFLEALVDDICTKRGLDHSDLASGPRPQVAAWLAGRPHSLANAPDLDPWL